MNTEINKHLNQQADPYRVHHEAGQRRQYGCVQCQKTHTEGDQLFDEHIWYQSKHGWYWVNKDGLKIDLCRP